MSVIIPHILLNKISLFNSHPIADLLRPFFQNMKKLEINYSFIKILSLDSFGTFSWKNIYKIHKYSKYGMKYTNVMFHLKVVNAYKKKWASSSTL